MLTKKLTYFFAAIVVFVATLFYGCTKTGFERIERPKQFNEAKFFQGSNTKPEFKRIAEELKRQNKLTDLLVELANKNGYPLWEESLTKITKPKFNAQLRSTTNVAGDTVVILPYAAENTDFVSGYILATLNDSVHLQLYRIQDYEAYGFGNAQDTTNDAENLVVNCMLLNFKIFGHQDFKILDNRILPVNNLAAGAEEKEKTVHVEHAHSNPGNTQARIYYEEWEYETCTRTRTYNCPSDGACCETDKVPKGTCKSCKDCWTTKVDCKTTVILVSVDDGDWGEGGGGATPPVGEPGGGSGGGGSTNPNESEGENPPSNPPNNPNEPQTCISNDIENGQLPCTRGDGWVLELNTPLEHLILTLGLTDEEITFLSDPQNEDLVNQVYNYLQNSNATNKTTIAKNYIEQYRTDADYRNFVENHNQTGDATKVWWEDDLWLQQYYGVTNFGNWAINYLLDNPDVDFKTFSNWFFSKAEYTGGEEEIDPDLITYEQAVQMVALPSLNDFETHFPKITSNGYYSQMSSDSVYKLVGGSIYQSHISYPNLYSNACAIRGSRGLLYSGITIPVLRYNNTQRTQKGGDNKNYVLDAVSFNKFMIDKFGDTSDKLTGTDANNPTKVAELLKGKNGIYVIINNDPSVNGAGYSGHVDLILNGSCVGGAYTTPKGGVKSIRVWTLN